MGERIGVFGGTFDPIHRGHLSAAKEVARALDLDRVIFVPAGIPWQKEGVVVASPRERLEMVELATASDPQFATSAVDVNRPGHSYMIDTLQDLRATDEYAEAELYVIVGADALAGLPTWKDVVELPKLATFVGVTRPGFAAPEANPLGDVWVEGSGEPLLVDVKPIAVSSSQIRSSVAVGEPVNHLTVNSVADYIAAHRLYKTGKKAGSHE